MSTGTKDWAAAGTSSRGDGSKVDQPSPPNYSDFLAGKASGVPEHGRTVDAAAVHPYLHQWQAEIVTWAARRGRAAIWADTGLGKTLMQIEWARLMTGPGESALIVAPLAVCAQTVREAAKVGVTATYVRSGDQVGPGLYVTNYEMVDHFDPHLFAAVVLDEASILKSHDGKTRTKLIQHFAPVPYRLACTATPAPNDPEELTNQAEFLGVMSRVNMLAAYFIHDSDGWRLKGHARSPMFQWMASWAVAIRRPSDMGYPDDGYILPGLNIESHLVSVEIEQDGQLFATDLGGVGGRAAVRRSTMRARCERAAAIVAAEPDEPWLIWCGLNDEAELLAKLIPDAVNVHGGWSPEDKADALLGFADGSIQRLITKPSLAAFGLNWQHCARMAFVGLSDSYEAYYQSIRRCYRYGQQRVVDVHIVLSQLEAQIADNRAAQGAGRGDGRAADGHRNAGRAGAMTSCRSASVRARSPLTLTRPSRRRGLGRPATRRQARGQCGWEWGSRFQHLQSLPPVVVALPEHVDRGHDPVGHLAVGVDRCDSHVQVGVHYVVGLVVGRVDAHGRVVVAGLHRQKYLGHCWVPFSLGYTPTISPCIYTCLYRQQGELPR